jgi:hypothetical protein
MSPQTSGFLVTFLPRFAGNPSSVRPSENLLQQLAPYVGTMFLFSSNTWAKLMGLLFSLLVSELPHTAFPRGHC